MATTKETTGSSDPFDLRRFTSAQEGIYATVLTELTRGQKRTHWMWFIFPQIEGLGMSSTSRRYAIKSLDEARAYLAHPLLGPRLKECTEAVLDVEERSAAEIFGYPDDLKLRSSMTLFAEAANDPQSVFVQVLQKYFHGRKDEATLRLLEGMR